MCPTRRLPASVTATIEGVVLYPPRLGITVGTPFSTMATHEFVVPRSMPITFSIRADLLRRRPRGRSGRLAYTLEQRLDATILRSQLRSRLQLPARVERQAGRDVDVRQGHA